MKLAMKMMSLMMLCGALISCSGGSPEAVFHDTQNNNIQLSLLKGKWIIVNYWAPWCGACISEIPELNHFQLDNQNKNIVIYGVNYDHPELTELRAAIANANIEFPVIAEDPAEAWHLEAVDVLPTTFIINPEGRVVKKLLGPNSEESLMAVLQELQSASGYL